MVSDELDILRASRQPTGRDGGSGQDDEEEKKKKGGACGGNSAQGD